MVQTENDVSLGVEQEGSSSRTWLESEFVGPGSDGGSWRLDLAV